MLSTLSGVTNALFIVWLDSGFTTRGYCSYCNADCWEYFSLKSTSVGAEVIFGRRVTILQISIIRVVFSSNGAGRQGKRHQGREGDASAF